MDTLLILFHNLTPAEKVVFFTVLFFVVLPFFFLGLYLTYRIVTFLGVKAVMNKYYRHDIKKKDK